VAAVGVLAGDGGSLRAILSPAGYGKTTMLHAAARAAAGDSRPVVAVATTAKAVAELTGAGLDAQTIARLRIDLCDGPLAAGTVVVLDEISQTPTAEVEAVLAAVDACSGGQVWVLGDPRQSQPVGPGGIAERIEILAQVGVIPSARLTVNRRQFDPIDRRALDLLRHGDPTGSQQLRDEQGWEHEHASPVETSQAMAYAVCDDIHRCGAGQVAALVVSHGDAEDLADRVRACLADNGALAGPALTGPGWTADREYQVGDRVLLHARCGPAGARLVNGSTATVTRVGPKGLAVRPDGVDGAEMLLPAAFVTGSRRDGAPNLSHAWARTVDGAQGGTFDACHLLGSSALDAYRGYTGQSRSRQPTHTWNTTRVAVVDHGGILADRRDGAEQTADALARQPDLSLAARSDPWIIDHKLRELITEHERILSSPPPDRLEALAAARDEMSLAVRRLADLDSADARSKHELDGRGPFAGWGRHGRDQSHLLRQRLDRDTERAAGARDRYREIAGRVERLIEEQEAFRRFETAECWRRADVTRLRDQLDHHWAEVISACVSADDPLAFGIHNLRHARSTLEGDRQAIDATIPDDRAEAWQQARRQLPDVVGQRQQAEEQMTVGQAGLQDAARRGWGRQNRESVADAQAQIADAQRRVDAVAAERNLRQRLAALAEHQQHRQLHIAGVFPRRKEIEARTAQIDAALDRTRPERVAALAYGPPQYLVTRIGPPPHTPAGRGVWCHHALDIEAVLDRNDGHRPSWTGWSPQTDRARHQIAVADRVLQASNDWPQPAEWAELAERAGTILDEVRQVQRNHVATRRAAGRPLEALPKPWIDSSTERPQPGIVQ
jgi:hypothetical protein